MYQTTAGGPEPVVLSQLILEDWARLEIDFVKHELRDDVDAVIEAISREIVWSRLHAVLRASSGSERRRSVCSFGIRPVLGCSHRLAVDRLAGRRDTSPFRSASSFPHCSAERRVGCERCIEDRQRPRITGRPPGLERADRRLARGVEYAPPDRSPAAGAGASLSPPTGVGGGLRCDAPQGHSRGRRHFQAALCVISCRSRGSLTGCGCRSPTGW